MKTKKVKEIGNVCSYCGTDYALEEYEVGCCGEVHSETGYETLEDNPELILESELNENYEVIQ